MAETVRQMIATCNQCHLGISRKPKPKNASASPNMLTFHEATTKSNRSSSWWRWDTARGPFKNFSCRTGLRAVLQTRRAAGPSWLHQMTRKIFKVQIAP